MFKKLIIGVLAFLGIMQQTSAMCSAVQTENVHVLNENNFIAVRGPVTGQKVSEWTQKLFEIEEDELYLFLTTPGGSVFAGNQFISSLDSVSASGKNIICVADIALSMGFAITQNACPTRLVMDSSILMQHQMSGGVKGDLKRMQNYLSFIGDVDRQMNEKSASRLNLTVAEFDAKTNDDWWIFGRQNLVENTADESTNVLCHPSLVEKRHNETFFIFIWEVNMEYSGCPLARDPLNVYVSAEGETFVNPHLSHHPSGSDMSMLSNYINNLFYSSTYTSQYDKAKELLSNFH